MTARAASAAVLILVPIAFNVAFTLLGRAFEYPGILRRPTDEILRRFDAGGARLRTLWWAFMLTALAMLPMTALLGILIGYTQPELGIASVLVGAAAAIVQTLGLARWPFVVPELARRWVAAASANGPAGDRAALEVTFVALHRYLGIGVGEHLGYLLTGAWTVLAGWALWVGATVPGPLALLGLPIGLAILIGSLEFVGPSEPEGWALAGRIILIAYIAWSIWLIALGVALIVA